ncbi:MAG: hypothetical protein AABX32_05270 [Nanoarchaeota archaeon]
MNKKAAIFAVMLFALGWVSSTMYAGIMSSSSPADHPVSTQSNVVDLQKLQGSASRDKSSPSEWIKNSQINVFNDEVVLKIKNAKWAVFTDTKSMDPIIDSTSKAIQIIPENEVDIHVGDIVAYKSSYGNGTITHRVIQIGHDSKGWFAMLKGDNNNYPDPEKVRFEQIKSVVVAIIY